MLYVLILPTFAGPATEVLDRLRARFEPERAAMVPLHLTLVFGAPAGRAVDLHALCATIAAEVPPFQVVLTRAAAMRDKAEGGHKVGLQVGKGASILHRLHARLNPGQPGPIRFRPHMTVATAAAPDPAAVTAARALPLPIGAVASRLVLEHLDAGRLTRLGAWTLTGP
jgi:2'-5' RNA ligase